MHLFNFITKKLPNHNNQMYQLGINFTPICVWNLKFVRHTLHLQELTEKMSKGITLTAAEQEKLARLGDITGKIARAKEDLDRAQTQEHKEPSGPEPPKKSENDIQWENLIKHLNR